MNTVVAITPRVRPRIEVVSGAATLVAVVGWMTTGLLAAIPAGVALIGLAASDLSTHRFSLRMLGIASMIVAFGFVLDASISGSWARLSVALVGTATMGAVLAFVWLRTRWLAFGDVLLVTFAAVVPLQVSGRAVAVLLGATALFAAAVVASRILRYGSDRDTTIALAPPLAVGWICGVVVG